MKKLNYFLFLFFIVTICFYSCDDDNNPNTDTFKDKRDGQVYKTVKIGEQTWMAENLKYLPSVAAPGTVSATIPYYYVYGYYATNVNSAKNTANFSTYGVLYNWSAAIASSTVDTNGGKTQGVCPEGWHLPSYGEFNQLKNYLGGSEIAGGKIKDTVLWNSPNYGATNEVGFSALPAGILTSQEFSYLGKYANWWMCPGFDNELSWGYGVYYLEEEINSWYENPECGYSIRCIKD